MTNCRPRFHICGLEGLKSVPAFLDRSTCWPHNNELVHYSPAKGNNELRPWHYLQALADLHKYYAPPDSFLAWDQELQAGQSVAAVKGPASPSASWQRRNTNTCSELFIDQHWIPASRNKDLPPSETAWLQDQPRLDLGCCTDVQLHIALLIFFTFLGHFCSRDLIEGLEP
jgi:hypothetical protein